MIRKSMVVGVLFFASLAGAAHATPLTDEQKDAFYLECRDGCINNGNDSGFCEAQCYQAAYGGETSGGGGPNQIPNPKGGFHCYGGQLGCDTAQTTINARKLEDVIAVG